MLDVAPVQWRLIRTVRPKYSCRSCEKNVQTRAPVRAIARGMASFATLAHVVVNKFHHHRPLYRQAEMMAAQGIDIDRSTLASWAGQAAALLDPIVSRIRDEGLKVSKIHADDTPVPMLVPGKGKTALARLWTYVVDDRASNATDPALVWYRFRPIAAASIRRPGSSTSPASSRPRAMPASTGSMRAAAYAKSPAWRTSGTRYSRIIRPARRRLPPICWNGSPGFIGSSKRYALGR